MGIIGKIIELFQVTMETPPSYGWFHFLFVAIVAAATVLICVFFKNSDKKVFNKIVMIAWITMVILEIYKHIVFSFEYIDGKIIFDYSWYIFPFQLCSTPLYVFPFIFLLKEGKLRDCFLSYAMTFSFFGGFVVMIYPGDVFCSWTGINIQTMIHHGLQVVIGVFCMVHNRNRLNLKFWVKSIYVFAVLSLIAMLLNIIIGNIILSQGIDEKFNMFYISPYFDCTLPLLSLIYPRVPYIVFLLMYILGFTLVSYIMYFAQTSIYKLVLKKYAKQ